MFDSKPWNVRGRRLVRTLLRRFAHRLLRPGEIAVRHHVVAAELAGSEIVRIPLDRLHIESLVRISGENPRHIDALAQVAGALPPIVVHRPSMTVIDGAHRVRAAQAAGAQWIDAMYFDGDEGEALLLAIRLNRRHGLPLSAADRKAAAKRALSLFPEWSNRMLGEMIGLPERTIAGIRRQPHVIGRVHWGRERRTEQRHAGQYCGESTDSVTRQAIRTDHSSAVPHAHAPTQSAHLSTSVAHSPAAQSASAAGHAPNSAAQHTSSTVAAGDPTLWADLLHTLPPQSAALLADFARRQADNWAALADAAARRADVIAETSAA
ncbi:hypothetical protein D7D52_33870 [Nocardia yunnanensis]|uniref:ParB-like N-terminal domain-containing protein n=1 Tax=Nocardia yunnanensis TaxID=2382165 RepID=A0A386ZJD4_9NOCA|nr:ParB/RepB/Spo0J family partition protein [Nocardia yunnanensis]AYF77982.1 hypothetical protein D7D52_33870 [Nocardia yunnanensis]